MSEERDAMRKADEFRANSQESPTLTTSKKIRFLGMLKRGASNRELYEKMRLLPKDIAVLKGEFGIVTANDIEVKINTLERELNQERMDSAKKTESCPQLSPHKRPPAPKNEPVTAHRDVPDMAYVFRNRRLEKIQAAVDAIKDDDIRNWRVPSQDEKSFARKIHLGTTHWADYYCVPRCIIIKEILRLVPDFDLDNLKS